MRLYVRRTAPNALKVLVFAAERKITLDTVDVDALSLKEFRCISPLGIVPALVTRNGSVLTESLTICRYLDEVSPGELLFGHSAEERATIGMWERRSELMLLNPAIDYIHHTLPEFTQVTRQFPTWARQDALSAAERLLPLMEAQLLRNRYLAGNRFSAADITAYFGCSALKVFGLLPEPGPNLTEWLAWCGCRPSFAPLHAIASAKNSKARIAL